MASLVWIAAHFRAVLASHVALKLVDRRRLRPPHGKHEIGKIGSNSVLAEVSNEKVVGMSAGNLPVHKVKSSKKMAGVDTTQIAANGPIRLAQATDYYGYCFDTGVDVYCYWYAATDVIVTDAWAPYPY